MEGLYDLKKMYCHEIADMARKGELSPAAVDLTYKMVDVIKDIATIEMYEENSNSYASYEGGGSYRRGRSMNSYMGENESYDGGDSYRRGYSRDDGKNHFKTKLQEMMKYASDEEEKRAIRKVLKELDE